MQCISRWNLVISADLMNVHNVIRAIENYFATFSNFGARQRKNIFIICPV